MPLDVPGAMARRHGPRRRCADGRRAGRWLPVARGGRAPSGERAVWFSYTLSLHANTQVPAHRRDQLERLIRYTARGAVALERLAQDANGDFLYTFTHPWSDGTTGIGLSPAELLEKLAALVPLPRVHLIRYGGCLAPHSHLRGAIIPTPRRLPVTRPPSGLCRQGGPLARRCGGGGLPGARDGHWRAAGRHRRVCREKWLYISYIRLRHRWGVIANPATTVEDRAVA